MHQPSCHRRGSLPTLAVALAAVALATPACSYVLLNDSRPAKAWREPKLAECTESPMLPVVDTILAVSHAEAALTLVGYAAAGESGSTAKTLGLAAASALLAGVFFASADSGWNESIRCGRYKAVLAARDRQEFEADEAARRREREEKGKVEREKLRQRIEERKKAAEEEAARHESEVLLPEAPTASRAPR